MDRKLFGLFSGWHLTAMFAIVVMAPGAVVAAVNYQAVSIVNPSTGSLSFVDGARRLYVLDPLAAYANDPSRVVNIRTASAAGSNTAYTVPTGNILVIKSLQWSYYNNVEGTNTLLYLTNSNGVLTTFASSRKSETIPASFEAGLLTPAGPLLVQFGGASSAISITTIQGYLIPASAAPALASSSAPSQFVSSGKVRLP